MTQEIVENRFKIDSAGLKNQMREVKPFRVVQEIISNSLDEDTARNIKVTIEPVKHNIVTVRVIDDGEGFEDIRDVYTLFKYSKKRGQANKRGRFNLGEKQFFAEVSH